MNIRNYSNLCILLHGSNLHTPYTMHPKFSSAEIV